MNNKPEIPLHIVRVDVWIRKGDSFLLAKRSVHDDQAAGKWSVPGGKVEIVLEDNIVENAVKREVKEEVGVEISNISYIYSRSFIHSSGNHVVVLGFVSDYVAGEPKALEDHDEIAWVKKSELKKVLPESYWEIAINSL